MWGCKKSWGTYSNQLRAWVVSGTVLVDVGVTLMRWGLQEHPDGTVDRELLVWVGVKPEMWTSQWNAVEYRLRRRGQDMVGLAN